jgi:ATP-dependent DNA helicase RecG
MVAIEKITASQAAFILGEHEGQRLDFKSRRIAPATLSKSLSAFANTDGGEIYIGIEDDRLWDGFPGQEVANPLFAVITEIFSTRRFRAGIFS